MSSAVSRCTGRLLMLDPRGTGRSATSADPTSYRCDRQVDDVEALREHLALDRLDLLAHSAGANLALLYAARHPQRVAKLVLVTPSTFAIGISATGESRLETARLRRDEPWFGPALRGAASDRGRRRHRRQLDGDPSRSLSGRWDAAAQDHQAAQVGRQNEEAAAAFGADGVYDPPTTRAQLGTVTRAGPAHRRRSGPELDPERRGRAGRPAPQRRARRPARRRPLPVGRRCSPVRRDDQEVPGLIRPAVFVEWRDLVATRRAGPLISATRRT